MNLIDDIGFCAMCLIYFLVILRKPLNGTIFKKILCKISFIANLRFDYKSQNSQKENVYKIWNVGLGVRDCSIKADKFVEL